MGKCNSKFQNEAEVGLPNFNNVEKYPNQNEYFNTISNSSNLIVNEIKSTLYRDPTLEKSQEKSIWSLYIKAELKKLKKEKILSKALYKTVFDTIDKIEISNELLKKYRVKLTSSVRDHFMIQKHIEMKNFSNEFKQSNNNLDNFSKHKSILKEFSEKSISKSIHESDHPVNILIFLLIGSISDYFEELMLLHNIKKEENEGKAFNASNFIDDDEIKSKNDFLIQDSQEKNLLGSSEVDEDMFYLNIYLSMVNIIDKLSNTVAKSIFVFYNLKIDVHTNACFLDKLRNEIKDTIVQLKIYDILFNLKSNLLNKKNSSFKCNLYLLFNVKPKDLALNPFFCLDQKLKSIAMQFFVSKSNSQCNSLSNTNVSTLISKIDLEDELSNSNNSQRLSKELELSKINEGFYVPIPFESSINKLKENYNGLSLFKKLELMQEIRNSFNEEIASFWHFASNDSNLNESILKKISFDADNTLMLFTYVIIKSKLHGIYIDYLILNDISSEKEKLNKQGYLITLVLSSCEIINRYLDESLFILNREKYNTLFLKEKENLEKIIENN